MARKPKGLTKPIAKTAARMSRKAALTPTQLEKIDAYWRASNYLAALNRLRSRKRSLVTGALSLVRTSSIHTSTGSSTSTT